MKVKLSETLLRDKEQLKKLPDTKSRITFIWDYYKALILLVLFILGILITVFISNIGRKDACMYAVLFNSDSSIRETDTAIFDEVLKEAGYDMKGKTVDVNDKLSVGLSSDKTADIETMQVLTALFTISDLDLYVADQEYFDYFAEDGGYLDLSRVIEEELLDKNKNDLYYFTDSKGNMILSGIILHEGSVLHEAGFYHDDVIMGVVANANNPDCAIAFIRQVLNDRK